MKLVEKTFRVSCSCGRPVRAGVLRGGERVGTLFFFDEKDGVPYDAERITCCSDCGMRLDLIAILRRSG